MADTAPSTRPKSMSFGAGNKKCATCNKTVYPVEMISADEKVFHKTGCFKCTHCQKTLSPGNYAGMGGVYYCKPHFKQLFALKGNYDEGFGKEQHKKKWAGDAPAAGSSNPEAAAGVDSTLKDAPKTEAPAAVEATPEPAAEAPAAVEATSEPAAETPAEEPAADL